MNDPVETVDYRQARGALLAQSKAKAFRHIAGDTYLVPSASGTAGYVVDVAAGQCTCPDHEERGLPCKHQWALRYFRHELELPDGTSVVTEMVAAIRKTYPQKWRPYNRAQCEEKERVQILLRGLCDGIVSPKKDGPGRPRLPLGDAVYAATMKVYTTVSGRRADTDIRACEERGLVEHAPAYNSVFKIIERPDLRLLFKFLVEESAAPLKAIERTFAADSTGFATNTYARWFDHKYGEKRTQRWVKLHAMIGTVTNVITAAEVTESHVGDSPMLAPMAERTKANGFDVREVSLDKAYLSHENLALVERLGGVPYIPFKSNSGSTGSEAWERMFHLFSLNKDDFLAHYHRRSNVESTFGAVKKKFGESVRSRLPDAQYNEVLLKCLCFNLSRLVHAIHVLKIEPKFWMPQTAGGVS
jgi:transposase